jgi:hypothetical protein
VADAAGKELRVMAIEMLSSWWDVEDAASASMGMGANDDAYAEEDDARGRQIGQNSVFMQGSRSSKAPVRYMPYAQKPKRQTVVGKDAVNGIRRLASATQDCLKICMRTCCSECM